MVLLKLQLETCKINRDSAEYIRPTESRSKALVAVETMILLPALTVYTARSGAEL